MYREGRRGSHEEPDAYSGITLMTPGPEPRSPANLAGSKWTSRDPALAYCHWVVIARSGDDVVLQSVLSPATTMQIPWRGLRDRERWQPGWS